MNESSYQQITQEAAKEMMDTQEVVILDVREQLQGGTHMKKLFDSADVYLKQSDWKDLALIKFCLASIGLLVGLQIPKKHRKPVAIGALIVFFAAYIPLMTDFFRILFKKEDEV